MSNKELLFKSAHELADMLKNQEITSVELTQTFLDRIHAVEDDVKAFITVTDDLALDQAKQADQEIQAGNYKGPMHGMPIAIKDTYKTAGVLSTSGSGMLRDYVPEETSTPVQNILDAGGVILGKLNMHSLGPGSAGFNPWFGHTRNPFNLDHIVGGSSGGSGAALAAGMAPIVTGTDMWGSLRVPASINGVYGFKPTYGLLSSANNIPTSETHDSTGPMARQVDDLAMLTSVMSSYDPKDHNSLKDVERPDYTRNLDKGIKGLKFGVPSYYRQGLDAEVERLFNESIEKLEELGAEVVDIEIPELEMTQYAGQVTPVAEAGANYFEELKNQPENIAKDVRAFLMAGSVVTGQQYVRAQKVRRKMALAFNEVFQEVDAILGPTIPVQVPAFKEESEMPEQAIDVVQSVLPFTVPANMTGVPALSVPMGLDKDGLPTGMQFFGRPLSEEKLLQIAKAWESTHPISYEDIVV
ncbi:amidase [Aerococcus urinae]|uniref:amidase n=1 Tax=Aerococcus TaxID=1375 RepID=UPI0018A712F3|nr:MULTISPECIES: amidase [Aerococcus]MCY3036211.1 amidase [Aerococcus sp. Group 2]MDK6520225.1 amidase [Aerococcus urinae]